MPNPLIPDDTRELQAKVPKEHANVGIAFDGDADRVGFVDEGGQRIHQDIIMMLLAEYFLTVQPGATIVYDLRSSQYRAGDDYTLPWHRRAQPRRPFLHQGEDARFISSHMHTGMESKELNGVLPFLLFFMGREKTRILDVEYWFMEPDGTIQKVPGFESGKLGPTGAIPGVRIVFESAGSPGNKPQTLYYFRLNLYDRTFRRNSHFITFLQNFGPLITFMKSASYVMFDTEASFARQFVLDQSRCVLQEDSGIPFRYFDPSVWALQFYGTYSGPISIFKYAYQEDLAGIYETGRDIKPLPFGIGYHFQVDTANLLFATRK